MRCINNTSHHSERRVMAKITSLQNPIIKVIGIKQWHLHGNLIGPLTFLSGTSLRLSILLPFLCSLHGHRWWPLARGFRCCRRRHVQLGILIFPRRLWSVQKIVVANNLVFPSSWCEWSHLWEKLLARIKMKRYRGSMSRLRLQWRGMALKGHCGFILEC